MYVGLGRLDSTLSKATKVRADLLLGCTFPSVRIATISELRPDHVAPPTIGISPGRMGQSHYSQAEAD